MAEDADIDPSGGQGTLRTLANGQFLVAYEAQTRAPVAGVVPSQLRLRHYASAGALLQNRPTEVRTLPLRLSRSNEGTPSFRTVTWRGSLKASTINLGFHYLDHGPAGSPRRLAVDRQGLGRLDRNRWFAIKDAAIDRELSRRGFDGNHGSRRQFQFRGKAWRIYEAQRLVNVERSWRVLLYDPAARTFRQLGVRTPRGSISLANPTVSVLPSPSLLGEALVTTMLVFLPGSGAAENGELVYYNRL